MNRRYKITIISLAIAILSVGSFYVVSAINGTLSDKQIEQVKANCVSAENTLNRLHISDALLRVNRGQIYESIHTKLMEKFNTRLANNKLDNKDLSQTSSSYKLMLDGFRADYISYEEQLSRAVAISCQDRPFDFYEAVMLARDKRLIVYADTIKLNQLIDQYRLQVTSFEQSLQPKIEEVN